MTQKETKKFISFNGEDRAAALIEKSKETPLLIATHNECFHPDDVMAYAVLSEVFPTAELVRTRDPEIIDKADIVFDVGMVFDAKTHRYDHHQREGAPLRVYPDGSEMPYSSAGLIWRFFGRDFLRCIGVTNRKLENVLWSRTDDVLFGVIDAQDNGLQGTPTQKGKPPGIIDVISSYNLSWDEDNSDESIDHQFVEASKVAGEYLINMIKRFNGSEKARMVVMNCLENSHRDDIILLPTAMPFKTTLANTPVQFVIMHDNKSGNYQVQCVPNESIYDPKSLLPRRWRGLSDNELSQSSSIKDAVFVHRNGFFGVAKTLDAAVKMAEAGIEESRKDKRYKEMESSYA